MIRWSEELVTEGNHVGIDGVDNVCGGCGEGGYDEGGGG